MSDADNIPDTYLNKAQIAVKYSISRVTVDRYLKRLENEGRLFPKKVQQGKRVLYHYDPNDLDNHIMPLLQNNKKQVTVQKNVSSITNVQTQSQIELLRVNLQNAEKRLLEKDDLIADLKDQREKNYKTIEFLQTQITDQRPVVLPDVSEPVTEEVVPPKTEPKPSTLAEIKEAVADADKSNVGRKQTEIDEYNELLNKISSGTYSDSLEEAVETQRIWNFISVDKESFPPNIVTRWSNRARATRVVCLVDLTETASGEMKVGEFHDIFKISVKDDIDRRASEEPYIYMVDPVRIDPPFPDHVQKEIDIERDKIAKEKADASPTEKEAMVDANKSNDGLKDVAPEEQPKPLPSPPTLDINEAVEDEAEKEARRTQMVEAPKVQKKKPKGLIAWLKGY